MATYMVLNFKLVSNARTSFAAFPEMGNSHTKSHQTCQVFLWWDWYIKQVEFTICGTCVNICVTFPLHMCIAYIICATYVYQMCNMLRNISWSFPLHMCSICATYVFHLLDICQTYVKKRNKKCATYATNVGANVGTNATNVQTNVFFKIRSYFQK